MMSLVRRMESRQALVRHHTWPWVFVAPLESSCLPRPTAPPPIIESIEGLAARRKAQGDAGSHRQVPIVVRLFPQIHTFNLAARPGGEEASPVSVCGSVTASMRLLRLQRANVHAIN